MIASVKKQKSEETKSDKKKQQPAIVQVEFCTNCDAHLFTVRHQQHKYFSHFDNIRKKLQEQKLIVKKRPVPQNLYKKSPYCPSNVYYRVQTNEVVYFPEIGSFQVYFQGKKIFSKLDTLKWPTPQGIIVEIQRILEDGKTKNEVTPESQRLDKSGEQQSSAKKQLLLEPQHKRQQFRIKSKQPDEHLSFRYSIDRRNLFRKPDNNYLNRKSMTARNQSVSESTSRTNRTAILHKRNVNQEEVLPITEEPNKKQLTDEAVLQMYRKNPLKNSSGAPQKTQPHPNLPQIPKKTRKNQGQGNIYLQPIFPKSNISLQNYTRQKQIIANKIHEQRKSYEASKQFKRQIEEKPAIVLKAKFNENCNQLLKNKEDKKALTKIKEDTEENQIKNKEVQAAQADKKASEEPVKIQQAHEEKTQEHPHNAHKINKPEKEEPKEHILAPQKTPEPVVSHISHKEEPNEQVTRPTHGHKQQSNVSIAQKHHERSADNVQKRKTQNQQQVPQIERPQPQQNQKNEEINKENAQQEPYEAEFEEQQEKKQNYAQNAANIQIQRQQEPPKETTPHDDPVETNKQEEKQQEYQDEQFDKEQPEAKQGETNKVNTADMAQLINERTQVQEEAA